MALKKWLGIFVAALVLVGGLFAGFNALIDPFGIFGDALLDWWSYNMTENPRTAKITWLDSHHGDYDAYIVGCSKTSSFPTERLNEYFDASFYNMIMYGEDLYDVEKTVEYILENYGAEHIVVVTGLQDMNVYDYESDDMKGNLHAKVDGSGKLRFYGKYLFANPEYALSKLEARWNDTYLVNENKVFLPETGEYDKSLRDVEPIGSLEDYLDLYPEFLEDWDTLEGLNAVEQCLGSVERIKDLCEAAGATMTYIVSPVYEKELYAHVNDDLMDFFTRLADITDYWDFSGYHTVAAEPRYFYDTEHLRNTVGAMALARMFGDDSVYVPEDFGAHVTADNVEEHLADYLSDTGMDTDLERVVTILMYHEVGYPAAEATVTPETFRDQMEALLAAGYETVTFADLTAYVNAGTPLPEKPLLITFDDGYQGNLDYAAPILEELGMCAAVSIIGVTEGEQDTYKDTGRSITPHFSLEDAVPWVEKGVLEIQSHSYDMHNVEGLDTENYRQGVYPREDETEEEYAEAFAADFLRSKERIEEVLGTEVIAYAYPFGYYTDISEVLLSEMGVEVTVTSDTGLNTVVKGLPQSLRAMNRVTVEEFDGETLINFLEELAA